MNEKNRRRFLQTIGGATALGLAGCIGSSSSNSGGSNGNGSGNQSDNGSGGDSLPSKSEGVETWGKKINTHAKKADIKWDRFDGTNLRMGMNDHPFTDATEPLLTHFEDLTGISVSYDTYKEDDLWNKLKTQLSNKQSTYDGFFMGLWPSSQYYAAGYTQDLSTYWNDKDLTDKKWFHREDYTKSALDSFTYKNELSAIPFGVEPYGCVAYDEPTFDKLGIQEPSSFEELKSAAKKISESDKVDKAGIGSRASSTTLSTADWASMFRSYGAEWIDYKNQKARLNSKQGVNSLRMFSTLMSKYGPDDIGSFDWTKNIQTYGQGQLGMAYITASVFGSIPEEQRARTNWIPPLEGPNGEQVSANWQWGLGISKYSKHPKAAWLLLQWLNCRPGQLYVSSPHWKDQPFYGWARNKWLFDQKDFKKRGPDKNWQNTFTKGMSMVPSKPPAVPLDVPQNMDIMKQAATAMNSAVTGTDPKKALDAAAPKITKAAKQIPKSYLKPYQ